MDFLKKRKPRPADDITARAVAALNAIDASDSEVAHGKADDILLTLVEPEVVEAYAALTNRCKWWASS